jgi:hypothetical protein
MSGACVGGEILISDKIQIVGYRPHRTESNPTHPTHPTLFSNRKALWCIACVGYVEYVGLICILLPPTLPEAGAILDTPQASYFAADGDNAFSE